MILGGLAVAKEENPYLSDEKWAQKHKMALWEGNFIKPQEFRKQKREEIINQLKDAKKTSKTANKNK